MREILNKIFHINGYKYKDLFESIDLMYFTLKGKEYYTLCFINNLNYSSLIKVKEISNKLNVNITKEEKSNNTIIVCAEVMKTDLDELERNIIFDIEEDTISFKKYVLWYTKEEVENFKKYYFNDINGINDISNLICDSYEEFENFKKNKYGQIIEKKEDKKYTKSQLIKIEEINRNKAYALLLRLCIKMPFLILKYLPPLKKDINEFIVEELEKLKSGFSDVIKASNISDDYLNNINLEVKEIELIEKQLLNFKLEEDK